MLHILFRCFLSVFYLLGISVYSRPLPNLYWHYFCSCCWTVSTLCYICWILPLRHPVMNILILLPFYSIDCFLCFIKVCKFKAGEIAEWVKRGWISLTTWVQMKSTMSAVPDVSLGGGGGAKRGLEGFEPVSQVYTAENKKWDPGSNKVEGVCILTSTCRQRCVCIRTQIQTTV